MTVKEARIKAFKRSWKNKLTNTGMISVILYAKQPVIFDCYPHELSQFSFANYEVFDQTNKTLPYDSVDFVKKIYEKLDEQQRLHVDSIMSDMLDHATPFDEVQTPLFNYMKKLYKDQYYEIVDDLIDKLANEHAKTPLPNMKTFVEKKNRTIELPFLPGDIISISGIEHTVEIESVTIDYDIKHLLICYIDKNDRYRWKYNSIRIPMKDYIGIELIEERKVK